MSTFRHIPAPATVESSPEIAIEAEALLDLVLADVAELQGIEHITPQLVSSLIEDRLANENWWTTVDGFKVMDSIFPVD